MQDNINIQFLSRQLWEDIEETSTTSGAGAYLPKAKYKKQKGERTTGGEIYKDLWEDDLGEVFTKDDYDKISNLINSIKDKDPKLYDKLQNTKLWAAMDPYDTKTYDDFEAMVPQEMRPSINENYSRFKNQTKTRTEADQFHQAIREVKKRVQEINKVFEYVNRLKNELNEAGDGLKYKKHTEAAMSKIKEMVSELNVKIKKFK